MALDGGEKFKIQKSGDAVERVRQRDEAARTEVRTDQGKISPKLTEALRELKEPKAAEKLKGGEVRGENNSGAREISKDGRDGRIHRMRTGDGFGTDAPRSVSDGGMGPKAGRTRSHLENSPTIRPSETSPTPKSSAATSNINSRPQAVAASTFTVVEPKPQLADVLIRRSVPPTPPKTADAPEKNRPAAAQTQEPLPTTQGAKGIAALPQTAQGTQTADPKFKDKDSSTKERGEEKRTAKNEKSSGKAGKGSVAPRKENGDAGEGQALQAASSGVTSGGEPLWIADIPPTLQIYNETSNALPYVLIRHQWYRKYVEKNPDRSWDVVRIFEKAVQLDGELEKILKEGLAARANVYGGTSA